MSQGNALDRLIKKQKPTVPARIDVVNESVSHDVKTSERQEVEVLKTQNTNISQESVSISPDSKTTLSQDYQTQSNLDAFSTVRNTIRIESTVDEQLRRLCNEERITKETFLEAAYLYLLNKPDEMAEVIQSAQKLLQHRKAIADYKRAKTMQQRFLES
jgi:hypothetical protein